MKTTIVRAFVLTLVSTGLAASAAAAHTARANSAKIGTTVASVPVIVCGPNDPTCCGLD